MQPLGSGAWMTKGDIKYGVKLNWMNMTYIKIIHEQEFAAEIMLTFISLKLNLDLEKSPFFIGCFLYHC